MAWSRDKEGRWQWRAFDRQADDEVKGETYIATAIGMKVVWKITHERPAWWTHDCAAAALDPIRLAELQNPAREVTLAA